MYRRPRRITRFVLAFLALATVIGTGSVLAAIERDDPIPAPAMIGEPPAPASREQTAGPPPHMSSDCRDPMASFLNSTCHAMEPRKLHAGHLVHRLATVAIGRTDARETGRADDLRGAQSAGR
jgi:hypothetical protein